MADTLLLGLDIGGTTSRVLLADSTGRRIRTGTATGGNPSAYDVPDALAAIEQALGTALHGSDPGEVRGAVIGLAGVGRLLVPEVADQFNQMWHRVGLRCPYRAVADIVVAFAAGTAAADGTLLLAGTGAAAAQLTDRQMVRIADGHGWLLGDLGSGFWIGQHAVRACLSHLDGWTSGGPMVRGILNDLLGDPEPPLGRESVSAVINAVRADPPVALSRFARQVCQTAASGDPLAREIVSQAADHLVRSASLVRTGADGPLVLAGGLLTSHTALAEQVRRRAADHWPGSQIGLALDGAAGAAWLAALELPEATGHDAGALHARLVGTPDNSGGA